MLQFLRLRLDFIDAAIWKTFYQSNGPEKTISGKNAKIPTGSHSYFLSNCKFVKLRSSAINFNSDDCEFLHYKCEFNKCTNNGNGGAIYFSGSSSIIQYQFTATRCTTIETTQKGQFCYISISNKNVSYSVISSISECENENASYIYSSEKGKTCFKNSNVSFNKANTASAIRIYSNQSDSIANYSQFSNNTANKGNCIIYVGESSDPKYTMTTEYCNIIGNSFPNKNLIIYCDKINALFSHCSIINNTNVTVFSINSLAEVTLSDSYFDKDKEKLIGVTTKNQVNEPFTNEISPFKFTIPVEIKIIPKKCTCDQNIFQLRIRHRN